MHLRSPRSPFRAVAAAAALALAVAGCGDDDDDAATTASSEAPASDADDADDADTSTTMAPPADDGVTDAGAVEIVDSSLGEILASGGRTLYVFTPDAGGAPTCAGDCAATWPPLLADGDVAVGEGLDAALFGTVARDDGSQQVTVDGWPLYFYAADAAPGDVNGQGVGDRWWVVGPDGVAIQQAAALGGY